MPDTPAPAPIEVRLIRPEEAEEAGALVESAYAAGGLLDNDRDYGAHVRDVAGRIAQVPVLVAVLDGRIVGSVTIAPHASAHSEVARDGEVEFRYLGVAREAWGSGVATRLVAAVERWAVETGATRLVLCVISENVAAEAVYARMGFTRAPERDWEPVPGIVLHVWQRPVAGTPG